MSEHPNPPPTAARALARRTGLTRCAFPREGWARERSLGSEWMRATFTRSSRAPVSVQERWRSRGGGLSARPPGGGATPALSCERPENDCLRIKRQMLVSSLSCSPRDTRPRHWDSPG